MKKFAIVIILIVYGLSSTGAVVHLDYCCGKISKVSLLPSNDADKACHGKTMHGKKCCDSKEVLLKVKGEQLSLAKWMSVQKQVPASLGTAPQSFELVHGYQPINEYSTGPPLVSSGQPLFIQHCVFRI